MNFSKDITSGKEGFYWLEQILTHAPNSVVIMITAFGDVEMAVRALKAGATDFILKPWQNEKLIATIINGDSLEAIVQRGRQIEEGQGDAGRTNQQALQ